MTPNQTLSIIVAVAENGVIGKDNKLLWRLSDDLKNFKRLTTNHAIIMGRKTFDSIGRALPNRINIVISRSKTLKIEGCEVVNSIEAATEIAAKLSDANEVFIIGGDTIYRQTLPLAATIYYTKVYATMDGDAFFPALGSEWQETERTAFTANEKNEFNFDVITFKKK